MRRVFAIVVVLLFMLTTTQAAEFNVKSFGAVGDGKTKDTDPFQKAINAAGESGGVVKVPAGTYLLTPVQLRSKVTLQLDASATIKGSENFDDYPQAPKTADYEGIPQRPIALINAVNCEDVAITGTGTLDGSGEPWWAVIRQQKAAGTQMMSRPFIVHFVHCKNIRIEGVTFTNSPNFHLVTHFCDNVDVKGVKVISPANAPNTDGIDPRATSNMRITDCLIDVGDDNIAIKSGNPDPQNPGAGCRNITVENCTFKHGHGMSIGSETNGGVKNLVVKNCTFEDTGTAIRIKTMRGAGGNVEDISYSDITMKNVDAAITFTEYYPKIPTTQDSAQPVNDLTPKFHNFRVTNLTATGCKSAGIIVGLPESRVSDVLLKDVKIEAQTGLVVKNADGVKLDNVEIIVKKGDALITENATVEGSAK